MDWCVEEGHCDISPCARIPKSKRPKAPKARTHYLKLEALARLWKAADHLHVPVWRDLARFLIALPCRRGEATGLDWSHIDFAQAEWCQPDKVTKNGDPHRLHLHHLAAGVLEARWRARAMADADGDKEKFARLMKEPPKSGLVFPAPRSGGKINTFTDIAAELIEKTALEGREALTGWTWHDSRRSFVTVLAEAGVPEVVADAMLNHRQAATRGGVMGVYQRSSRWPEQIEAMQLWGRVLEDALRDPIDYDDEAFWGGKAD